MRGGPRLVEDLTEDLGRLGAGDAVLLVDHEEWHAGRAIRAGLGDVGLYGVSGAQPAEVFSQVLDQAWTASHPVLQMAGGDADACGPDGCAI